MIYLVFRRDALDYWSYELPQWQRERIAETLVGLLIEPRPRGAQRIGASGDRYETWAADRRIVHGVFKDDATGEDRLIVVYMV